MVPHEDFFADMIIKLSRFHHSMSSSEGLQLTNSLMKNAEIENEVKEHKLKNTCASAVESLSGTLGSGC